MLRDGPWALGPGLAALACWRQGIVCSCFDGSLLCLHVLSPCLVISCYKRKEILVKHSENSSLSTKQTVWVPHCVMVSINGNQYLTDVFECPLCALGCVLGDTVQKNSVSALDRGKKSTASKSSIVVAECSTIWCFSESCSLI